MKRESFTPIVALILMASCNSAQPSDNSAENVATDYGTAVDASDLENQADMNEIAFNAVDENKADAIRDYSEPDTDRTVRNKQR